MVRLLFVVSLTFTRGLEARVPFLDTQLLELAMTMPPEYKHPKLTAKKIEKELLRKAFDFKVKDANGKETDFLLPDILWRQKEQFSDGVGYSWIDLLKKHAESMVTDALYAKRSELYPYDTPTTKEAFYFRGIFESMFCPEIVTRTNNDKLPILQTVKRWIPRKDWGCAEDPSGRAQKSHDKSYEAK